MGKLGTEVAFSQLFIEAEAARVSGRWALLAARGLIREQRKYLYQSLDLFEKEFDWDLLEEQGWQPVYGIFGQFIGTKDEWVYWRADIFGTDYILNLINLHEKQLVQDFREGEQYYRQLRILSGSIPAAVDE